jgi:hypothetical protein
MDSYEEGFADDHASAENPIRNMNITESPLGPVMRLAKRLSKKFKLAPPHFIEGCIVLFHDENAYRRDGELTYCTIERAADGTFLGTRWKIEAPGEEHDSEARWHCEDPFDVLLAAHLDHMKRLIQHDIAGFDKSPTTQSSAKAIPRTPSARASASLKGGKEEHMGAWGNGPTSNDTAADWFYEIRDAVMPRVQAVFDQFEQGDGFEEEVRAACFLLAQIARNYTVGSVEDIERGIALMRYIRDSEWMESWPDPDLIRKEFDIEINGLEWARDHFFDENIFQVREVDSGS